MADGMIRRTTRPTNELEGSSQFGYHEDLFEVPSGMCDKVLRPFAYLSNEDQMLFHQHLVFLFLSHRFLLCCIEIRIKMSKVLVRYM